MMSLILILLFSLSFNSCSFMNSPVLPYENQEAMGLPVFYIHPKPISKDFYSPATVIYKGKSYDAEARIRGGFTAYSPKKSYTIRFSDSDLFNDPELGSEGFTDRKKILLVADFDDNSHIRNRLAQKIWEMMQDQGGGLYSSPVIQTDSSVVYTNGSFEGLYTVIDAVNEQYFDRYADSSTTPSLDSVEMTSGGNLYKGDTREANFYIKNELYDGFSKKMGTPESGNRGAYDDLTDLILFVNNSSDDEFADASDGFSTMASVESYYDWWFFSSFISAGDSMNKNAYHYHNPHGLWYFLPWDYNQSFGQNYITKRKSPSFSKYAQSQNGIFKRLVNHPGYETAQNSRYSEMLDTALELDQILAEVDTLWDEVQEAAEADWDKWGKEYRSYEWWENRDDFTTPREEVDYIKMWITSIHGQAKSQF
ncbi:MULTISPECIES: CotH kinase family protein [unclassified Oceanispirochaeta]|nr:MULTISPECIES: CotH kinase family protein [unclassified Oceanispirochaeta]MBF9017784.1 CotH kinase family protein [Oceanispirochaeta sp. M2]NPD74348.1 hypothetical protein [Oceanispirochaeta sp. M1]RDG29827.1 hypothetical protein DV872_19795 [Oceanispirochaeta sp. M1]